MNTTTGTRGSITAFTNGVAVLPFTKGPGGTYLPNPPQGWAYTTYNYSNPAHKHAVTGLSSGESYSYDANGNMTQRVEGGSTYTQNFNAENMMTSVVVGGQTTTFVYDGDGQRVKGTVAGVTTTYVGSYYEVQGATTRKYYYLGSQRVAMLENSTVYYLLGDHLGSTTLTVNSAGAKYGELRYKAFGETRYTFGTTPTTFAFTGQRQESGLGLYFYNARWYDPGLGRFIQADTIVPDWKVPQSLNRYSYVLNSPLRYVDPTGHRTECSGTDAFISEETGDGGISWASCWARQRDKGLLILSGVADEIAEDVATLFDDPYLVDFIDLSLSPSQRDDLISEIDFSLARGENLDDAKTIVEVLLLARSAFLGLPAVITTGVTEYGFELAWNTTSSDLDKLRDKLVHYRDTAYDQDVRLTVGTNQPLSIPIPYSMGSGYGIEFFPNAMQFGVAVNQEQILWHWAKPQFTLLWLMTWRLLDYGR